MGHFNDDIYYKSGIEETFFEKEVEEGKLDR